ncbi:MAG: nucleotidyltransferase family protein [Lachnospiraceae bacterium]|nr:nucleotidyltransferase family protein [Lachnospiraceae bacterium]
MKVAGIIAEYNPIHEGHRYHIDVTRKTLSADAVVVAMSGSIMQRGIPAFFDKFSRTESALKAGADLVLELPAAVSAGSAEYFATGGVRILNAAGITHLSFGSECGDTDKLTELADILATESTEFKSLLQYELKAGTSYPLAVKKVLDITCPEKASLLDFPNNSLGVEYIKAIKKYAKDVTVFTVKRLGAGYNSEESASGEYPSSTSLRNTLVKTDAAFLTNNDFSDALFYAILEKADILRDFADISPELANRILNLKNQYSDFDAFAEALKTKQITRARINRCLWHILGGITAADAEAVKSPAFPEYVRVLGFRKNSPAQEIIAGMTKSGTKVITRLGKDAAELSGPAKEAFEKDLRIYDIYRQIMLRKYKNTLDKKELDRITKPDYSGLVVLP